MTNPKKLFLLSTLLAVVLLLIPNQTLRAQNTIIERMRTAISEVDLPSAGESGEEVQTNTQLIVGRIINAFLSLFGIIFLILVIYGGYRWMMASGREEELSKAKSTIRSAVIGLIIVLSAYAISYFITQALQKATAN